MAVKNFREPGKAIKFLGHCVQLLEVLSQHEHGQLLLRIRHGQLSSMSVLAYTQTVKLQE